MERNIYEFSVRIAVYVVPQKCHVTGAIENVLRPRGIVAVPKRLIFHDLHGLRVGVILDGEETGQQPVESRRAQCLVVVVLNRAGHLIDLIVERLQRRGHAVHGSVQYSKLRQYRDGRVVVAERAGDQACGLSYGVQRLGQG